MAQYRHRITYFASDEVSRKRPFELFQEKQLGKTTITHVNQVGESAYEISCYCSSDMHEMAYALDDHDVSVLRHMTDDHIASQTEDFDQYLFPEYREGHAAE